MIDLEATLLAEDFVFLEAPRWHSGEVWVPDVFDRKLYRIGLDGSKRVEISELPAVPNSIGFLPDNSLLVVSSVDRRILRYADGELSVFADLAALTEHHLNDFVIDKAGGLYVGNFGYDLHNGASPRPTELHRIDPAGDVSVVAAGTEFPNGMAIIEDGRTLVVAETFVGRLSAFDRATDGSLSNRRIFAELGERSPDGICADAQGAIWFSSFSTGEVCRVLDGGEITHRISFDGSAVACHLGGVDGRTLFCTTYQGSIPDQLAKKRLGALHMVSVDIGHSV